MAFANEPGGSTLLTEWNFSSQAFPDRWGYDWPPPILSDGGAGSLSPPTYARQTYPTGFVGGVSPNNFYYFLPSGGVRGLYASYFWRPSNPWQGHSGGGNKISFFAGQGLYGSHVVYEMYGPATGPWDYAIYFPNNTANNAHLPNIYYSEQPGTIHMFPNVNATKITLGVWHELELLAIFSSTLTSRDGIMRWWADGELIGSHDNMNFPQDPWYEFWFSPTWGGTGDTKTQTDHFDYDHVRISLPGGGPPPVSPPAAPTGLAFV